LKAPSDLTAHLELSTAALVKVWMNGTLLMAKTSEADKQVYEVKLRAGDNPLMIKAIQMKQDSLDLSVQLRATDGGELRRVSARAR
jgi:hypothetical protein